MNIRIDTSDTLDPRIWDEYIYSQPASNLYQCSGWFRAIEAAYGHKAYFITAHRSNKRISGVLPLISMRELSLRKALISAPFCDMGGIAADDPDVEGVLLQAGLDLAKQEGAARIELRQTAPLSSLNGGVLGGNMPVPQYLLQTRKVRMVLHLPASAQALFSGFKSKLRSQIRRPEKDGFTAKVGGRELLGDFYHVFIRNMRDLGSPVHSRSMIEQVMLHFGGRAAIVVVYKKVEPAAASLIIGFGEILANPWASALREFSQSSPNMMLYWTMLTYACDRKYGRFDFGRSTPGEGTHRFKKQWGAREVPLAWYVLDNHQRDSDATLDAKSTFSRVIDYWTRMPVSVTRLLGPRIRKHIGL